MYVYVCWCVPGKLLTRLVIGYSSNGQVFMREKEYLFVYNVENSELIRVEMNVVL